MITKEEMYRIIWKATYNPEALDMSDWEKAIDDILERISWKSMDSAPKDRPIMVWAYSSAEWWKRDKRERKHMLVEWDSVNDDWLATAGAMGEQDGSALCADNPIAWMELLDGPK